MGVLSSFSGISVNDEILSQYNPLFIVNSKTNVRCVFVFALCVCVSVCGIKSYQSKRKKTYFG